MIRVAVRSFKSWTQYQAEKMGISEAQLLQVREKARAGAYETWKKQNENSTKLKFILDHCNKEEQKVYLKDFSTEELGRFLLNELQFVGEGNIKKLLTADVSVHALPVVKQIFELRFISKGIGLASDSLLSKEAKLRHAARKVIEEKLKELEWRKLDSDLTTASLKVM